MNKIYFLLLIFIFIGCSSIYQTNPLPKQADLYLPNREMNLKDIDELEIARLFDLWVMDYLTPQEKTKPTIWSIGIKKGDVK
ncbi:hypothetical protein [Helicobacter sp. MIT 14-3879]|uniref:hypothetical protein n=1 Tax=Helicobacter sp. MIT 14-3879 TaxID=2040649 RepID=UPI000E1F9BC3|nr:hypothetical protein [Helicobacter sp. MIT 14-3879]RDU61854.1 hypothetical protein CQA44_07965 [Helicobacter sp. MIT 14-3879]